MKTSQKRHFGDRYDARWVKEATAMQTVMAHIMPNRTDCELCIRETFDVTDLLTFLKKKHAAHPQYKTTVFHCIVTALSRMATERPLNNRFVQGGRIYARNDISVSYVCKRSFADDSEEALLTLTTQENDTLDAVSLRIAKDVKHARMHKHATGGIDALLEYVARMPRLFLMAFTGIIRVMDFWGMNLSALTEGDPHYCTFLCSNLGSIGMTSIYHHLTNYGTNSIVIALGKIHKESVLQADGTTQIRDMLDMGITLDERIADGFYFSRNTHFLKYVLEHPEILDMPLSQKSDFEEKCPFTH